MSQVNRTTAKSYFETGDVPSQQNFSDLIDSVPFFSDAAVTLLIGTAWDGSPKSVTLAANTAITLSSTRRTGFLIVRQDGTGSRTLTLNGTSVGINSAANMPTIVCFLYDDVAAGYIFTTHTNIAGVSGGIGGGAAVQLSAPTGFTASAASGSQVNLSWNPVTNASGYRIFVATTNNFAAATVLAAPGSGVNFFNHTGLNASTTYYYWLKAAGDGANYSDSNTVSANATTSAGAALEDIVFSPVVGLTNASGVWQANAGTPGTYTNYGLGTKKLAAGQDGYIEFQYVATDGQDAILAFNTAGVNQGYSPNNYEAAMWITSSGGQEVFFIDGGNAAGAQVSAVLGNYYRIIRTGSQLKLQTSADHITWTDLRTFGFSSSADLFINGNVDAGKKLYHPKGSNLS